MKKVLYAVIFVLLFVLFCQPVLADDGVEGQIYSTDILAFVNGKPIEGYNIGGRTVVIAEDLPGYGFSVAYDDVSRTLTVESYFHDGLENYEPIPRGKTGKVLGDIYRTDIKVYYNGILVKGYNIGGRTAICLEDLGDLTDSPNADYGYSQYLGKSIWNPEEKSICFESFMRNESEIFGVSRVYHTFRDNVLYTHSDDFCAMSEIVTVPEEMYSPGAGASRYLLKPLYLENHGELMPVGLCVKNPNTDWNDILMYIEKPSEAKTVIKTFKTPQKTHDEALAYFLANFQFVEKTENEKYTVLRVENHEGALLFVYINKQGGFVVEDFFGAYKDREIKFWFEEYPVNSGPNTVVHSVYPFGGPHGTTTAHMAIDLDEFDYE